MYFKRIFLCLGLLVFLSLSHASYVQEYHLHNGLRLLVKEDHRAPVLISEIWYKVGSSSEPNGITGISHALEHMMFRGTHIYGPGKLEQKIAINGGEQNAFTDSDFTTYYQKLSADKLAISFELEADRMRNLLLRPEDFAKEIQVVMEERRMRIDDNPQETLLEQLNAAAFVESPYHHPVIGWENDLQTMSISDLKNWYSTWYAPNNAILVVVGDINPKKVYELAQKYFSHLKPSALPRLKEKKDKQSLKQLHLSLYIPTQLPGIAMAYPVPVFKTNPMSADPYVLDLIATLLSGGNSTRFAKNLIRGQQIAADANAFYNPINRFNNLFLLQATPTPGHSLSELESSLRQEIKQLQTHIVSLEELRRAKTQINVNKNYQKDSIASQAYLLGSLAALDLPWIIEKDYLKHINAVTPRQIQAVANKYLQPHHLTVAYLHPLAIKQSMSSFSQLAQGASHAA